MRRTHFKLDEASDRFRKCPYCGKLFMATHRSRKFCYNDNWCHDEYNNRLKREKKISNLKSAAHDNVNFPLKKSQSSNEFSLTEEPPFNEDFGSLSNNIKFLSSFEIPAEGLKVKLSELEFIGINPYKFSKKTLITSEDGAERYSFEMGEFEMRWEHYEYVTFINKTTNQIL
jgi:ribosomal protein S27AE